MKCKNCKQEKEELYEDGFCMKCVVVYHAHLKGEKYGKNKYTER